MCKVWSESTSEAYQAPDHTDARPRAHQGAPNMLKTFAELMTTPLLQFLCFPWSTATSRGAPNMLESFGNDIYSIPGVYSAAANTAHRATKRFSLLLVPDGNA